MRDISAFDAKPGRLLSPLHADADDVADAGGSDECVHGSVPLRAPLELAETLRPFEEKLRGK